MSFQFVWQLETISLVPFVKPLVTVQPGVFQRGCFCRCTGPRHLLLSVLWRSVQTSLFHWTQRALARAGFENNFACVIFSIRFFFYFRVWILPSVSGTVGCCRTRVGKQHVTHRCFTFAVRSFENLTCQDRHVPPPRGAAYTDSALIINVNQKKVNGLILGAVGLCHGVVNRLSSLSICSSRRPWTC